MIKNFLKGLVFGAAVGTVGGLFFAPRSGNDTRKKLIQELDEATELTNELNNSLNHFKRALAETKETASTVIPEFQEAIQKDIEDFKFQAEPRIAQINEQVEKLTADLPDSPYYAQ
ncbi:MULTISPECIES: YtxH domain-containing protein [unclassified Enterococcus]|uniref:YtxH domain-containing protein n=1 Tax=unclassified Enterococcus TaxID=2608891 RepID=UPI0013EC5A2A|nr:MULTISPECIES: YtxH domain-containing protein [unclassified Enterococcus]